jgi:pimeloyl-ACP methyl ester carboxylesterase
MKKTFVIVAAIVSCTAAVLAFDLGRFAFTRVNIEGHEFRLLISGHGSPVVVFETGGSPAYGSPLEAWERVQPAVSQFTRTVSYDRAGIGWSAPGPKPRDARQVAGELHAALRASHVEPPYILVGHSFGGPLNRVFAGMYPDEIAGIVLVDPTQEEFIDWNQTRDPNHQERRDEEWKDIQTSLAEAHESQLPPEIPVIVITAMGPRVLPSFATEEQKQEMSIIKPMWLKFHDEWVKTIPNGQHIITKNSGHSIPFEEPELVIKTIRDVVDRTSPANVANKSASKGVVQE